MTTTPQKGTLNCPGCERGNDPKRRYCGGCGCSLVPICRHCQFSNDSDDRFCGGCGSQLLVDRPHVPEPARTTAAFAPAITELGDLFAPSATASLTSRIPKIGVSQDDLDLLFGDPQ